MHIYSPCSPAPLLPTRDYRLVGKGRDRFPAGRERRRQRQQLLLFREVRHQTEEQPGFLAQYRAFSPQPSLKLSLQTRLDVDHDATAMRWSNRHVYVT